MQKSLVCITAALGPVVAAFEIARHTCCPVLGRIIGLFITNSSVVVMIICYLLMTVTLLKNTRATHRNIGVQIVIPLPASGACAVNVSARIDAIAHPTPEAPATAHSQSIYTCAKQARNYKNMYLLFTVTVVFIVSWLPLWLAYGGLSVPRETQQMYMVNSAINPFIYSFTTAMFRNDLRTFCRTAQLKFANCVH